LQASGYINSQGLIQDSLRTALRDESFFLPAKFAEQQAEIISILRKLSGRLAIKDADDRQIARPRQTVLDDPDFKDLWDRIKHKTTYRVEFDSEDLLADCVQTLRDELEIPKTSLQWRKADLGIGQAGVEATETSGAQTVRLHEGDIELPDLLTELQNRTQLTRRSLVHVFKECRQLDDFKRNPQSFIEHAAQIINGCKQQALVDGVKYRRIGDGSYYAQELFNKKEVIGYMKDMLDTKKSIYDKVIYESETEKCFAEDLENNIAVKVYAKLPGWFKVPTPLGSYNPDWAVLIDSESGERLYLVAETKGSTAKTDLRSNEQGKIECGKKHFKALEVREPAARYKVAARLDDLLARG